MYICTVSTPKRNTAKRTPISRAPIVVESGNGMSSVSPGAVGGILGSFDMVVHSGCASKVGYSSKRVQS